MSNLKPDGMNRRQFLGTTGLAVAMFNIGPSTRAWGAEHLSANDKINIAGIGIGSQGGPRYRRHGG